MIDRYRLVEVDNDQLVAALSGLVRREHDLLSDLLAHLAELDERRLYLDFGYSSLFAYCTEKLALPQTRCSRIDPSLAGPTGCTKFRYGELIDVGHCGRAGIGHRGRASGATALGECYGFSAGNERLKSASGGRVEPRAAATRSSRTVVERPLWGALHGRCAVS